MISTQSTDFFWSVRRRRYWRTCRRKYFLYYYAARGGFDLASPQPVREFYAAKRLIPLAEFVRRIANFAMRESFYAAQDDEAPAETLELFPLAARRAEWEFSRMLANDNRVTLLELVAGEESAGNVHHRMLALLDALCGEITRNAWSALSNIPKCDRRPIESPLELAIAELKCFLVPVLAVRRAGEIWLLENTASTDAGNEIAVLGKFAAAKLWGAPPQTVRSFVLAGDGATFTEIGADADVSEVLRGIRRDVEEMSQLIHENGTVDEDDFPADASHCATCVFRFFCRQN